MEQFINPKYYLEENKPNANIRHLSMLKCLMLAQTTKQSAAYKAKQNTGRLLEQ